MSDEVHGVMLSEHAPHARVVVELADGTTIDMTAAPDVDVAADAFAAHGGVTDFRGIEPSATLQFATRAPNRGTFKLRVWASPPDGVYGLRVFIMALDMRVVDSQPGAINDYMTTRKTLTRVSAVKHVDLLSGGLALAALGFALRHAEPADGGDGGASPPAAARGRDSELCAVVNGAVDALMADIAHQGRNATPAPGAH